MKKKFIALSFKDTSSLIQSRALNDTLVKSEIPLSDISNNKLDIYTTIYGMVNYKRRLYETYYRINVLFININLVQNIGYLYKT